MRKIGKKIWMLVLILCVLSSTVSAARYLVPGGQVVGLELGCEQVVVAAFDKELGQDVRKSGLREGDRITYIDNIPISSVDDVKNALKRSDGTVTVRYTRKGKEGSLSTCPSITAQGPKLGVYLKEGVTGLGTVTWYDPDNGKFATLGHGVSISGSELVPMAAGRAYEASVVSVKKGAAGQPGQLIGAIMEGKPVGSLTKNTQQGVFGRADWPIEGEPMAVAKQSETHTGEATILSTVSGKKIQEYSVEILKIYPGNGGNGRNLLLKVTDPRLLSTTGGIVQGMSGSPIIQDGKLVGAVTHVLVNDPTTGYGIFVENMLQAAG